MTLAASDTIDLMTLSRDGTTVKLFIVATEDVSCDGNSLQQLQLKLNFYESAITSGKLDEIYPQYALLSKIIQVDHHTPLSSRAEAVMTVAGEHLSRVMVKLVSRRVSYNPLRLLSAMFRTEKLREWNS